ncbi:dienelactone hydrolase family protein [Kitasatospora sp. LaBMicrA B282]|uniref:dienelactone hydrolase family protein n=1 Tax=Kitasatospora sp. LaBMicrA B282 TaxID=3420949 RepID=UPI003D0C7696
MCHPTDSRPPGVENPGEVEQHGPIELTSADGTVFNAYRALPAQPNGRSVVILPDVRGVHPYYQDLAQRFAEAGYAAVAVDYYGRTAGLGDRGDDFPWADHFPKIDAAQVAQDVQAAAAHLAEVAPGPVFTVGFCFGGSQSWRLSAADLGLAGVIGFYGAPGLVQDVIGDMSAPLLLLIAGADVATPQEDFAAFAGQLTDAGRTFEMQVYEGAPHSFFDRGFGEWQEACSDAWRRIQAFTELHGAA